MSRLLGAIVLLLLMAASCGGPDLEEAHEDGSPVEGPTVEVPADEPDDTPVPTEPPADADAPVSVAAFFDGEGARSARVTGGLFLDGGSARVCEVFMESYPVQCGGHWLVLVNPDSLGPVELQTAQGISWSEQVTFDARFDGNRLFVDDDSVGLWEPTSSDRDVVEAFLSFATDASPAPGVPFTEDVVIALGSDTIRTVPSDTLADRLAWDIDRDEHQGYAGPFSALDLPQPSTTIDDLMLTVGSYPRCVAPPVDAPAGFDAHRRLSIQPADATSCLEWWTVDFFQDDQGMIAAVTLDLFGP